MPSIVPIESLEIPSGDRFHYVVEYSLARHEYNGKAQMVMNFVKHASPEMEQEQEYVFAYIHQYLLSCPKAKANQKAAESHLALGTVLEKVNDYLTDKQVVDFMTLVVKLGEVFVSLTEAGTEAWDLSASVQDWESFEAPVGLDYGSDAAVIKYRNLRDEAHDMRPVILYRLLAELVQDKDTKDKAAALARGYFHAVDTRNAWACLQMRETLYYAASENGMNDEGVWALKGLLDNYEQVVRKMGNAKKIMEEKGIRLAMSGT